MDLVATPVSTPQTPIAGRTEDLAKRARIRDAAEKFEAQFLAIMLQPMFEGTQVEAPFGGGPGEDMFRSLMTEAMGKQMASAGGIGLADTVQREMLKMQGLD
ncbi:rod-binding protein [Phenylobacterium zucineum]|nr:rod-binding protein [Phenylobacterium zucineum]